MRGVGAEETEEEMLTGDTKGFQWWTRFAAQCQDTPSTWLCTTAMEFDGPSHFLTNGCHPAEVTASELLRHALVIVPYWEWEGCKGASEKSV
jgi:hypothetical protein